MAKLLYCKKDVSGRFIRQVAIWKVPVSKNFPLGIKYRFALVKEGKRVFGYDNKSGELHHGHLKGMKFPVAVHSEKGVFALLEKFLGMSGNMMKSKGDKID